MRSNNNIFYLRVSVISSLLAVPCVDFARHQKRPLTSDVCCVVQQILCGFASYVAMLDAVDMLEDMHTGLYLLYPNDMISIFK